MKTESSNEDYTRKRSAVDKTVYNKQPWEGRCTSQISRKPKKTWIVLVKHLEVVGKVRCEEQGEEAHAFHNKKVLSIQCARAITNLAFCDHLPEATRQTTAMSHLLAAASSSTPGLQ